MNRILSIVGLFLGLWTLVSLLGMFADGARISFWATGFSISVVSFLIWAPTYLYLLSRQVEDTSASPSGPAPSSTLAWLSIIPIAAFAVFVFSVLQIILGGVNSSWINTGIGAFVVSAITAPILIFMRGLQTYRQMPDPDAVEPFVEEDALPFSLSDLPTAPEDEEEDLGWPYTASESEEASDASERAVR